MCSWTAWCQLYHGKGSFLVLENLEKSKTLVLANAQQPCYRACYRYISGPWKSAKVMHFTFVSLGSVGIVQKIDSEIRPDLGCTMWVASPWGFSEETIQPARHECHACCLLRAGFLAFQPVADNMRGTRVEQVVSSFQKILRGSQLTWYSATIETSRKVMFWTIHLCVPVLSVAFLANSHGRKGWPIELELQGYIRFYGALRRVNFCGDSSTRL